MTDYDKRVRAIRELDKIEQQNEQLNEAPKLNPFFAFLCFDIPALGIAAWAVLLGKNDKNAGSALSWAMSGVKLRIAISVFVSALELWTAWRLGKADFGSLHGVFTAVSSFLDGLCGSLTLQDLLF